MRTLITMLIIYCYGCTFTASAQNKLSYAIKGAIIDTAAKTPMDGATITVLTAKDSILQKFTYTSKGNFEISNLAAGKFLLLVTYPEFVDYSAEFTLDAAHPQKSFGNIAMILKAKMLQDVIVKAKVVAIKIKGDTTEFNAAAYATQKNAKVEDLLQQLPGMRINQSGVILFQGEQVQKILVDGEEFFGDDPALVTKNVRADMVSKIQVYNDKSDAAKQTGIDDGQKIKTINVVLREDKKRGVFGKADAGAGTDKRYAEQLMANKFSPKEKMAIYGNLGNTGNVGLGGGDNNKYGGGFQSYAYNGVGIPAARDGGVHYDGKWNKDKQSLNSSYTLGALDVDKQGTSASQINLPGTFNRTNDSNNGHTHNFRQNLSTRFTSAIDSTSTLFVNLSGYTASGNSVSNSNTITTRTYDTLLNTNNNHSASNYQNKNANVYISLIKRLKKPGRSFSFSLNGGANESNSANYLQSDLKYYNPDGTIDPARSKVIDQYKPNNSNSQNIAGGLYYTEPLFIKGLSTTIGYSLSNNISNNNQQSFNKSASGVYDVPDLLFSNNYSTHNSINSYSLSINYNMKSWVVYVSSTLSNSTLKQTDHIVDTMLTRKFINWASYSFIKYQLAKSESIYLNYNGYTQQPSIFQIQPLRQNADPLNVTIGNPALKPAFNNSLSLVYYLYQATGDRGINFHINYSNQINAIISNRMTDASGANTYQYANLDDKHPNNWNTYFEVYGHPKGGKLLLLPNVGVSGNNSFNMVNNKLSANHNMSYTADLPIRLNSANYSYSLDLNGSITKNKANLQQAANDYKGYAINFHQYNKLPLNFFIGTDGNYSYSSPNRVYPTAISKFLLKAYFGKAFLKEENLKLTITGSDLLNQNTGYDRRSTSDSFTESRNNVIRRFFLFTVTWDFSKFGKAPQPQQK